MFSIFESEESSNENRGKDTTLFFNFQFFFKKNALFFDFFFNEDILVLETRGL